MLALMALIYSECTYKVCLCVCVSHSFLWQDSENCPLTGWYYDALPCWVSEQRPLYSASRIIADGTANRKMTILQMNISRFQHNVCRRGRLRPELWYIQSEKNVEQLTISYQLAKNKLIDTDWCLFNSMFFAW